MTFLLFLAIIIVLAPLASAAARRLERRELPGASPADVARLREELEQLSAHVNRLQDEQSFMIRLLSDEERSARTLRPGGVEPGESDAGRIGPGGGARDDAPNRTPDP